MTLTNYKPGDRVGAVLSSTPEEVKLLGYGVFAGDEVPDAEGWPEDVPNPKIVLDNGSVVWGYQCWWGDETKMRAWVGDRRVVDVTLQDEDS